VFQSYTATNLYIRLTDVNGRPTWINAHRILTVTSHQIGSRIAFEGDSPIDNRVYVKELPDEVMARLREEK
jgi:hypothetical protein